MIINCENLKTLPYGDKLKIVAGKKGIDRLIKWAHLMENPEYIDWLKGGELIFITGVLIKDNTKSLLKLIKDLNSKNVSGMVINVGPYIDKTPDEVIKFADSAAFPIFELPFEVRLIDITQSICKAIFMSKIEQESMNSFMKNLISGEINYDDEIINRAMFYGYSPDINYYSIVISIDNFVKLVKHNEIWDEDIEFRLKQKLQQVIVDVMHKYNKKIISIMESNFIILMVPMEQKEGTNEINLIAEEIYNKVQIKIKKIEISIGIGSEWNKIENFKNSVEEARKAIKVISIDENKNKFCNYEQIGIYKLLFEIDKKDKMKKIYTHILGDLIDYDNKNSTKLVQTLEIYIDKNCNLVQASDALFIHKNTLKYRIKRMENILNCDLRNLDILFNLSLAFKVRKFLICI